MSPAGPSPGGQFNAPHNSYPPPGMPPQYGGMPQGMPQGMPLSAGSYSRGAQTPGGYMGQPHGGHYGAYPGGYQG